MGRVESCFVEPAAEEMVDPYVQVQSTLLLPIMWVFGKMVALPDYPSHKEKFAATREQAHGIMACPPSISSISSCGRTTVAYNSFNAYDKFIKLFRVMGISDLRIVPSLKVLITQSSTVHSAVCGRMLGMGARLEFVVQ